MVLAADLARKPAAAPVLRALPLPGAPMAEGAGPAPVLTAGGPLPQTPRVDLGAFTTNTTMAMPPPFQAPPTQTFGGHAPAPTPYGAFQAPDPNALPQDPYYKFRLDQGLNGLQRSAAAHGSLLTGGFQKRLAGFNQDLASAEGDKIFGRALNTYTTNRDTNAQNYGQQMSQFQGDLGAFGANTSAALGFGRLGLDAADRQYGMSRDAYNDQQHRSAQEQATNARNTFEAQRQADEYAQQVARANGGGGGGVTNNALDHAKVHQRVMDVLSKMSFDPIGLSSPAPKPNAFYATGRR